ncbi:alpha-glucuronidase [Saccharothrix sp. ALI-22-I]|uniref:alpha-glucuronidase n=1 Tax=Saccharothrix sp. ALI-22-I TaxID=1933778 RepID=UPI00097C1938|nr:alpha-glucuronidase [Saccharothrix sp. ALI-22-I]ONI84676.1 alpha-glucuronidase [Saccharothrix sp. ALI-22-I]
MVGATSPEVLEDRTPVVPLQAGVHPAWLPASALRAVGSRRVRVVGDGLVVATVRGEVEAAVAEHGGALVDHGPADLELVCAPDDGEADPEAFLLARTGTTTMVHAVDGVGLLYGFHHVVRRGEAAFTDALKPQLHAPRQPVRMLDHWDNVDVHPVMGQVERGYAGDSIFYADGAVRADLTRARAYARLLGSIGVNRVALNNVNVHRTEARLLTDLLPDVVRLAEVFRPHGIRVHLSVSFAAPITLGGLLTSDPLDPAVRDWWARTTAEVYAAIPDFGGYVVKADSEGQPGPFAYGRDHADGANVLARALAPFGGTVFWRAFVYNHRQDWRDRSTDRARAAYDNFAPLDGAFDPNVVVQVKAGPVDFQVREPVSPVIAAMPRTRLAVELQVTQEYTGQQKHVCHLVPQWREMLGFQPWGDDEPTVADIAGGRADAPAGGVVAVSNVGDDAFWTGHPLAQANLFGFGRLAWDDRLEPAAVLDEWISLTFPDPAVRAPLHELMDGSWLTYERYTAPLGVGFMVRPGHHYGPDVDGYEYSPWGTYHFADRDGVGVDRTRATGTGFTGQYPAPWRDLYESTGTCPDELLLFFHHVPYDHVLHSGTTVIQHIYDTHFAGPEEVSRMVGTWARLEGSVPPEVFGRVAGLLKEQLRCAAEWRDQVNTYFWRKSGVPDAHGRLIH